MIDTTLVKTIVARIRRRYDNMPLKYCLHCGQNTKYHINEAVSIAEAVADHAEEVKHPEWYKGIYIK
jgi:hypothetical protein